MLEFRLNLKVVNNTIFVYIKTILKRRHFDLYNRMRFYKSLVPLRFKLSENVSCIKNIVLL